MDYIRDEHRVHLIMYHLVWTFFRRKKKRTGEHEHDDKLLEV